MSHFKLHPILFCVYLNKICLNQTCLRRSLLLYQPSGMSYQGMSERAQVLSLPSGLWRLTFSIVYILPVILFFYFLSWLARGASSLWNVLHLTRQHYYYYYYYYYLNQVTIWRMCSDDDFIFWCVLFVFFSCRMESTTVHSRFQTDEQSWMNISVMLHKCWRSYD